MIKKKTQKSECDNCVQPNCPAENLLLSPGHRPSPCFWRITPPVPESGYYVCGGTAGQGRDEQEYIVLQQQGTGSV